MPWIQHLLRILYKIAEVYFRSIQKLLEILSYSQAKLSEFLTKFKPMTQGTTLKLQLSRAILPKMTPPKKEEQNLESLHFCNKTSRPPEEQESWCWIKTLQFNKFTTKVSNSLQGLCGHAQCKVLACVSRMEAPGKQQEIWISIGGWTFGSILLLSFFIFFYFWLLKPHTQLLNSTWGPQFNKLWST